MGSVWNSWADLGKRDSQIFIQGPVIDIFINDIDDNTVSYSSSRFSDALENLQLDCSHVI